MHVNIYLHVNFFCSATVYCILIIRTCVILMLRIIINTTRGKNRNSVENIELSLKSKEYLIGTKSFYL